MGQRPVKPIFKERADSKYRLESARLVVQEKLTQSIAAVL